MKTAEEILKEAYEKIELVQDDSAEVIDPILLGMLHEYADQFKPKWISVEDELPKPGEHVLTHGKDGYQCAYVLEDGNWYVWFAKVMDRFIYVPTHWMPLPEKPE